MNRMLQVRIELHSLNENIWGRGGGHFSQSFITQHLLGSSPIEDFVLWHKQSLHAALAWPELTLDFIRIQRPRKFYRTHNYETAVTASASPPEFMLLLLNHLWTYHERVWQPTWTQGRPVNLGFFLTFLLIKLSLLRIILVCYIWPVITLLLSCAWEYLECYYSHSNRVAPQNARATPVCWSFPCLQEFLSWCSISTLDLSYIGRPLHSTLVRSKLMQLPETPPHKPHAINSCWSPCKNRCCETMRQTIALILPQAMLAGRWGNHWEF